MNTETITGPFVGMTTYGERAKPDWRSRCTVEDCTIVGFNVYSPGRKHHLFLDKHDDWIWMRCNNAVTQGNKPDEGEFSSAASADTALSEAPPYPGAEA